MKVSAGDQLTGRIITVVDRRLGTGVSLPVTRVEVVSVVAERSVKVLGLTEGMESYAVSKPCTVSATA